MDVNEMLISLVQQNPCLYDRNHEEYKNSIRKAAVWQKIAEELNQSYEVIKNKWKNLRDGYTKYKKINKGKTGEKNDAKKKPYDNWVWGPYLEFLDTDKHLGPTIMPGCEAENLMIEFKSEIRSSRSSSASSSNLALKNWIGIDPIENSASPTASRVDSPKLHLSRKRSHDSMEKLLVYLNKREDKDPTDLLFESYAKTLKKMKPKAQALLKLKLAQIFTEAELGDLKSDDDDSKT